MKRYKVFIRRIIKESDAPILDAWGVYANNEKEAVKIAKEQMTDHNVNFTKIYYAVEVKESGSP